MKKRIKTKESNNQKIKCIDKSKIYTARVKDRILDNGRRVVNSESENENDTNQVNYAEDKVMDKLKGTARYGTNTALKGTKKVIKNVKKSKLKRAQQAKKQAKRINVAIKSAKNVIKKVAITTVKAVQALVKALSSLISCIAAGGSMAVIIIVILAIIAGVFCSAFGMFFTDEENEDNISIITAMERLENEIDEEVEEIKDSVSYNSFRMEDSEINWKDILTVYSVYTTNREEFHDITVMNLENYEKLREIFWKVVDVDYRTEKYTVTVTSTDSEGNKVKKKKRRTRLIVTVECMELSEMIKVFRLNDEEKRQIEEIQRNEYDEMWDVILDGR